MKLMTKAIAKKLKAADLAFLESEDGTTTDEIAVKFFNPVGAATWYVTRGTPLATVNGEPDYETENPADWHMFGFANLGDPVCAELGYVLLSELEAYKGPLGIGIERDLYYSGGSLNEVMAETKAAA